LLFNGGVEVNHLATELANSSHWKSCDAIEQGLTKVLIKQV